MPNCVYVYPSPVDPFLYIYVSMLPFKLFQKKKRRPNWTNPETQSLLDEVESERACVLESLKGSISNQERKDVSRLIFSCIVLPFYFFSQFPFLTNFWTYHEFIYKKYRKKVKMYHDSCCFSLDVISISLSLVLLILDVRHFSILIYCHTVFSTLYPHYLNNLGLSYNYDSKTVKYLFT